MFTFSRSPSPGFRSAADAVVILNEEVDMELSTKTNENESVLRELSNDELDSVGGAWSLSGFGYTIGQDQIAGGGSYSYITKGGTTIYSELCWPQ